MIGARIFEAMRHSLSPFDHAFADGPVFPLCHTLEEARRSLPFEDGVPDAAQQLVAISDSFRSASETADKVLVGMGARIVNLATRNDMVFEGPSAIRGILRLDRSGAITIGEHCYLGDNTILSAHTQIEIGPCTLLAHNVQIFDNDSHPVNAFQREIQFRRMLGDKSRVAALEIGAAPVKIGSRVWIGMGSLVMKGVEIGDDSIVAAGSVVTSSIPSGVIVGGNPASIIRQLTDAERSVR